MIIEWFLLDSETKTVEPNVNFWSSDWLCEDSLNVRAILSDFGTRLFNKVPLIDCERTATVCKSFVTEQRNHFTKDQ